MKQLLNFQPIFTPGAGGVGTLNFTNYPGFSFSKLYGVIDTTQNTPLYVAGAPGLGATASGSIVTLTLNTSTFSSTDKLNVYYDTAPGFESNFLAEYGGQAQKMQESLDQILQELRVMNVILAQGLNINDDIDGLRNDVNSVNNNPIK
jgi:hypothetical protein